MEKISDQTLFKMMKKKVYILVHDSLAGNRCINFQNYFSCVNHTRTTQNNVNINLKNLRLKYAQNISYYMRAKVFNDLRTNLKIMNNRIEFKKAIHLFYS